MKYKEIPTDAIVLKAGQERSVTEVGLFQFSTKIYIISNYNIIHLKDFCVIDA